MKTFEWDGKRYEVVEGICDDCDLRNSGCCHKMTCYAHKMFKEIKEPVFQGFGPEHVGEKVWHFGSGNGVIVSFDESNAFPVRVRFKSGTELIFTTCGRMFIGDANRSIYFGQDLEVEIKGEVVPVVNNKKWLAVIYDLTYDGLYSGLFDTEEEAENWKELNTRSGTKLLKFEEIET